MCHRFATPCALEASTGWHRYQVITLGSRLLCWRKYEDDINEDDINEDDINEDDTNNDDLSGDDINDNDTTDHSHCAIVTSIIATPSRRLLKPAPERRNNICTPAVYERQPGHHRRQAAR